MGLWNWVWIAAIAVLIACIVIQRRALNAIAFGRSMFISGMAFVCSFVVSLTVPSAAVWIVFAFFQVLGWSFLLFMTYRSLRHMRERRVQKTAGRPVRPR